MKISNIKILLLLVLGAFTLTLPNTVRAGEKEMDWFEKQRNAGNIRVAGDADTREEVNKRNELAAKIKKYEETFKTMRSKLNDDVLGDSTVGYLSLSSALECGAWDALQVLVDSSDSFEELQKRPATCIKTAYEEAIKKANEALAEAKKGECPKISDILKGEGGNAWKAIKAEARAFVTEFDWSTFGSAVWNTITLDGSEAMKDLKKLVDDRPEDACQSIEKMIKTYQSYVKLVDEFVAEIPQLMSAKKDFKTTLDMGSIKGELYVYTDPKTGKKFLFEKNGDTIASVSGVTKGCIPMPAKLAESQSCLFCPLFQVIFNTANDIATASAAKLATTIAQILLLGFAIYVAFSVLKLVSSFTKQDGPKFVTELLGQAFKVFFAYVLLIKIGSVYTYIISPVLSAGLEFGSSLLFEKGSTYATLKSCGDITVSGGILPASLGQKIICFIKAVQAEISVPQTIASSLMCVARNTAATEVLSVKFWDFGMMFQGLLIYCFSWLISLAFAFYLIDATVRLGVVGALMPFLIACWPLKATSSYTGKGWEMFMNSFFTYVMLGLVVSVNVQLIGQGLTGGKGGFSAIEEALNGDKVQVLQDLLDIGFGGFLVLIACCLFGFKLCGQAEQLAGTMAKGGFAGNGAAIGGLAASGAKAVTLGAGKLGLKATRYAGEKTGVTPALRRGRDRVLGAVGRAFGFGRNSGAAGGSQARAAVPARGAGAAAANGRIGSAAQSTNKPGPNTPPPTPSTQAKQVQDAAPRNGSNRAQDNNGTADPVMNRNVQQSRQEADRHIHNYVGNKQDNNVAWDKYQKSEASLKQTKNDYETARRMAAQAKGTPDEAKYAAAAEKAAQRYAGVQKSHSQNEQNVQETQDKMNNSAINAYVNQQKAIAQRNGKSFDENKSREYARTHLDEIKKNLDTIIKSDPRYN